MYVCGLVIPVPEDRIDAYRAWAESGARFFKEYGCLEIVESWEDYVPDGKQTDFRRAVAARPGEKIVFTWQVWPDRESFQAAEAKMHEDPRMDSSGEPPFDASRLILGCFQPLVVMGRDESV
jgi:uncharacterized protein YbaA (DUF1428 family)